MNINIHEFTSFSNAAYAILLVTISFLCYQLFSGSEKLKTLLENKHGVAMAQVYFVVINRISGVFFFGIIPLAYTIISESSGFSEIGLNTGNITLSLKWILISMPIIIFLNNKNAPKTDNLKLYPQIRVENWSKSLVFLSALSWVAYLTAYEFMFRSFLLFSCYKAYGTVTAIAINVSLYTLSHLPKGMKETFGAIPFGILLCIITLQSNSILYALVTHCIMALSNEWFSLKAQPKMKVIR